MENFADEFKKVISVNTIKDGKLYQVNFIGSSEAIDDHRISKNLMTKNKKINLDCLLLSSSNHHEILYSTNLNVAWIGYATIPKPLRILQLHLVMLV
jgi:hypothetical protein